MKFRLNQDNTKLVLIESTKAEYNQLKLFLTRKVKNYRFQKRVKLGVWDGSISYFGTDGSINFGLWQEVYQCCKEYGYEFIIENKSQFPINKDIIKEKLQEFVEDFYKDHKTKEGKQFIPYDHQVDAIFQILKYQFGIVEIATAGGKSLIFGTLLFYYLKNINPDAKFLLIVPNINLVTQFYNDLGDYNYGFNSENKNPLDIRIDEVMSDKPRKYRDDEKKPNVYIGTYQSLEKWPREWFRQFDVVFTDECFHPETLITMSDGNYKRIKDINVGDLVFTINESNNKKEIKEVEYIYKNMNNIKELFEIELENGEIIKVTGNHKVRLITGEWKKVENLTLSDEISDFNFYS
jgi:hypothetical protein